VCERQWPNINLTVASVCGPLSLLLWGWGGGAEWRIAGVVLFPVRLNMS
jgi:hypothetical protein